MPDVIANLTALEKFDVSSSCLSEASDALFRLPALRSVSLNWNKLTSLPDSVGANPALQDLWLQGNLFKQLPRSLANVPNVSIEAKFKSLYTNARFKSSNRKKIQQGLFKAAQNAAFVTSLDRELANNDLGPYRTEVLSAARLGISLLTTTVDNYSKVANTRSEAIPIFGSLLSTPR